MPLNSDRRWTRLNASTISRPDIGIPDDLASTFSAVPGDDVGGSEKAPGWYPDRVNPNLQHYWSGSEWVGDRRWIAGSWHEISDAGVSPAPTTRAVATQRPSRKGLWLFGLSIVLLVGVAAGYFFTRSTEPTLTLQQAQQAFNETWPGFANGFATGNATELNDFGSPEMVEAVVGWYNCGCGEWLAQDKAVHLSVPVEHSYPLSFLAEVSTPNAKGGPTVQEVVLSKPSGADPWRVTYMVAYLGTSTYLGPSSVHAAPTLPFKVGSQFASFFESMVNTGSPPADGPNWPVNGSMKDELDRYAAVNLSIEQSGYVQHMTFQPVDHSTIFWVPDGEIMCGAIRSNQVVTGKPGLPIVQPTDRSNFGPLLSPGSYSSVIKSGVHDYCVTFTTNPTATATVVTPISFFGGVYQSVGQPG